MEVFEMVIIFNCVMILIATIAMIIVRNIIKMNKNFKIIEKNIAEYESYEKNN